MSATKIRQAVSPEEAGSLAELNRLFAAMPPLVPGGGRAVLGRGPIGARIALVGEQPGDQEDREGVPFVGPAGQVLRRALEEAALDPADAYVTNAVKHFKFEQRGKRRIHSKPSMAEIKRYRPHLLLELDFVRPRLTVTLGASALAALAGRSQPLMKSIGPAEIDGRACYVTIHPSFVLRQQDEESKARTYEQLLSDLRQVQAMTA
jgi:DNA polymerase